MTTQTEKITISLPRDLIQLADELAKEKRVSRSKVVSSCLRELADKRLRRQMEEGYKAIAKENQQFAEQALNLANEVLPEWE
jgi:metal-responsive CopG/Arc/MetJ family transcriptional regulator